jgi:hypothetical protein
MNVQELATKYLMSFTAKKRENGDTFNCLKDEVEDESLVELIRDAHNVMIPDDYKYEYILDALRIISDAEDYTDSHTEIESDCNNYDLAKWLASNNVRYEYCDQYIEEMHDCRSMFELMQSAQYKEREEVFFSVMHSLESIVEKLELAA